MEWTECISKAISYIEDHITEELTIEAIARQAMMSPFYFQKGFALLCGFTIGEYVKKRRLSLAGSELLSAGSKAIDLALKYGYDSPDSFTKAFVRFHGATPTAVRKGEAMVKSFAPLKIKLSLEGGYTMDYKIMKKDAFTLIGVSQVHQYDAAASGVPKQWADYHQTGKDAVVCSVYGVSIDENMDGDVFEYMIADSYNPLMDIPEGFVTKVIPQHTWAVFACTGDAAQAMQEVHKKVFSQWLPAHKDFEIAAGYHIEHYEDPSGYAKGVQDEAYSSEIWVPVRQK